MQPLLAHPFLYIVEWNRKEIFIDKEMAKKYHYYRVVMMVWILKEMKYIMRKNIGKIAALTLAFAALSSMSVPAAQWGKLGSQYFYYLDDGTVAKNTWIHTTAEDGTILASYWVRNDGVMAASEWVYDGEAYYYVDAQGLPLKDQLLELNKDLYWLDEDGKMAANCWRQNTDGRWYYFEEDGSAFKHGWKNIDGEEYYFLKSGAMASDALVPGGRVDASGKRVDR